VGFVLCVAKATVKLAFLMGLQGIEQCIPRLVVFISIVWMDREMIKWARFQLVLVCLLGILKES
jgi:hypothetical protein